MPGAIWTLLNLAEEAVPQQGDQAGFDAAKALTEAQAGLLQLGPGLEATALGTFVGNKTVLVRVTNTGKMFIGGLRVADVIDPTKSAYFDPSAIATGVERVIALPNWGGLLPLPTDAGVAGQALKSNGAGGQPFWGTVALEDALAAVRGSIMVGNAIPLWSRLPIGAASTLLKSDGVDPTWGTVDLLSAFHGDTLAAAVQAGDIMYGNATPKWARLAKGTDGHVLQLVAGFPAWGSVPAPYHTDLARVAEFSVANCKLTNGSAVITTSGSGFSAAKIGARVVVGTQPDTGWAVLPTIQSVDSDTQITVNTNWLGGTTGFDQTVRVIYNDHTQYLLKDGFGSTTDYTSPQQLWGNIEWRYNARANAAGAFIVEAGALANNPRGFGIKDFARNGIAFFDCLAFSSGARFLYRFPNLTNGTNGVELLVAGSTATFQNGAVAARQTVSDKDFTTNVSVQMDGTATYGVFRNASNADRLAFDLSAMAALRAVSWPDLPGRAVVRNAEGNHTGLTAALGSQTLATAPPAGMYRISVVMRCSAAGTGTSDFRLSWNDGTARSNVPLATLDLTGTNYAQATFVIYVSSGNVTYDTTFGSGATYDARVRMEAL